jgi:hypothetical protein
VSHAGRLRDNGAGLVNTYVEIRTKETSMDCGRVLCIGLLIFVSLQTHEAAAAPSGNDTTADGLTQIQSATIYDRRRQDDSSADGLVPFRHCQAGMSVGYSITRMEVDANQGQSGQSGTVNRWFIGGDIFPLSFLRLKGVASDAYLITINQQHFYPYYKTELSTYTAEASIMIPILWSNGWQSLIGNENGFFVTVGGVREWITLRDKYESAYGSNGIDLSCKKQDWTVAAGFLYRKTFRLPGLPPKWCFEIGMEYCPLFTDKFVDTNTGAQSSSLVPLSHLVSISQTLPVVVSTSLLFGLY